MLEKLDTLLEMVPKWQICSLYHRRKNFKVFSLLFLVKWYSFVNLVNNSDGSNTISSNIEQTQTSFFEHQMNSNVFIY